MNHNTHAIREAIAEHIVELNQTRLAEMVASYKSLKRANAALGYMTGVRTFFSNQDEFQQFRELIALPTERLAPQTNREWGDFQTPPGLAERVCDYLTNKGVAPSVVVEPTYGLGNFNLASLAAFPTLRLVYGVELQERYAWHLKIALLIKSLLGRRATAEIELYRDNVFTHEFPSRVIQAGNILVIGNPPWVTSAELGGLDSKNLPVKQNIKALNGMDALTGKSNFDISEYILLRLLDAFSSSPATIAMLCKTATAKNIVEILPKKQYPVSKIRMVQFDAAREFGVAVDACLLMVELGAGKLGQTCEVATLENPARITRVFGWVGDKFVSNVTDYAANADLDGKSVLVWRQGLKHDCARIMELDAQDEVLTNGAGERVVVENKYVYWLLKSSDLRNFEVGRPRKKVVVTQTRLGEDTAGLKTDAPKLWHYLTKHGEYLDQRKSSIYRGKPRFSIFGIGEYSFKKYKVAISGLYKEPNFALVCPIEEHPVLLDDTCYFLGLDSYLDALFTVSLFNSPRVIRFLRSIVFTDAKRPYTKDVLMRINVARAADSLSLESLCKFWNGIGYKPRMAVTEDDLKAYKQSLLGNTLDADRVHLRVN